MNESLEPADVAELRRPSQAPLPLPITYDDELEVDDPAFRYVVRRGTPPPGFGA
jgi:hypothetical protein